MSLADEIRNSVLAHGASMAVGSATVSGGAGEALATDFSHVLDSPDDEDYDDEPSVSADHNYLLILFVHTYFFVY